MLNKSNFFPEQDSQEEIVLFIRRHWIGAIREWAFGLAMILLLVLFILGIVSGQLDFVVNEESQYYILFGVSSFTMITLGYLLTAWIDYYLGVTIITKKHLINIRHEELLTRNVAEQSLLRVQDVSVRIEGGLQSWFKFGTVYVETAGEQPNFKMKNIPNPYVVANYILKLHEEMVREGSYEDEFKEGVGLNKPNQQKRRIEEKSKKEAKKKVKDKIPIEEDIYKPGDKVITIKSSGKIGKDKIRSIPESLGKLKKSKKIKNKDNKQTKKSSKEKLVKNDIKDKNTSKKKENSNDVKIIQEGEEIKF